MQRFRYIVIIILCFFSIQFLYSCRGCSKSGIQSRAERHASKRSVSEYKTEKPSNKKLDNGAVGIPLNQLFKKYQSAVFMVYTSDGENGFQGTGFFISRDGIAVSNYHVFEGTTRGMEIIKTANGQELKIERVIDQSQDYDYIIFKVRLNNRVQFSPIPVAQKVPEIGEDVFAIGNPHGLEHTLSKGIVSGYREEQSLIQTTTEITHGSSGGPLLNMQGEVVGITTAGVGEANLNFAINIQLLNLKRYTAENIKEYQDERYLFVNVKNE